MILSTSRPQTLNHANWTSKALAAALATAALTGIVGAIPAHAADTLPGHPVITSLIDQSAGVPRTAVNAELSEVSTGKTFKKGDQIKLNAHGSAIYGNDTAGGVTGHWLTDPDGNRFLASPAKASAGVKYDSSAKLPSAPIGALIGRIGDGGWFIIGANTHEVVALEAGQLFLAHNDVDTLRGDNNGVYNVEITGGAIDSPIADGRYAVALQGTSGLALTAAGGCAAGADAKPVVETFNAEFASRRWNVKALADGYVTINNDCVPVGKLATTADGKLSVGPATQDLGHNSQWAIRASADGNGYTLQNRATGQFLGTSRETDASGKATNFVPATWTFTTVP